MRFYVSLARLFFFLITGIHLSPPTFCFSFQAMSIGQVMRLAAQNGGVGPSSDGSNHNYTPAITAKAAALRSRTAAEMSLGDARKR